MPSVWTTIMDFVEASFQGIKKADDFNHDVGPENVGIWKNQWKRNWPEVNLMDARGVKEDHKRTDVIYENRMVQVEMVDKVSIGPTARQASDKMELMKEDVFKAMFRDHTQGGNAMDTDYIETMPLVFEDDNSLIGVVVLFGIRYRFIYNDLSRSV
jgi:hypothetical protein